jgi:hypothetical protein
VIPGALQAVSLPAAIEIVEELLGWPLTLT